MPICPHCKTGVQTLYDACPTGDGFYAIDEQEDAAYKTDPYLGRLIGRRFVVSAVIGHGSIGRVYRAHQKGIGREVVLKIFKTEEMVDERQRQDLGLTMQQARESAQERFEREAQVLGRLSHPNCVTIHDFGQAEDGSFLYIAMEYVAGMTMRRAIKRGLRQDVMLEIMRQALMGLREAHNQGITHRDLKPENIMLSFRRDTKEPVVKVLDFGIAKLLHNPTITNTGMLFGTPAYMSPEQCKGEADAVSPRSDVYALGCLFYELVCGVLPFPGKNPSQMLIMHVEHPIPEVVAREGIEINKDLKELIRACMNKAPEDRPASAGEVLKHLDLILPDLPTPERTTTERPEPLRAIPQDVLHTHEAQARPARPSLQIPQSPHTVAVASRAQAAPQQRTRAILVAAALGVVVVFFAVLMVFIFNAINP